MGCEITHGIGIYEMEQGGNGPVQDVTRANVSGEALTDGVGNLRREGGVEVAHQIGFTGGFGEFVFQGFAVPGSHAEDVRGPINE